MMNLNDRSNDYDHYFLAGDPRLMLQAIEAKVDEIGKYTEALETSPSFAVKGKKELPSASPRFLKFINAQDPSDKTRSQDLRVNIYQLVRHVFQAKYLCDRWHERMGRPLMRFPEFLISYHCKDGDNMFTALQRCGRLWRAVVGAKLTELKLFHDFLTEECTVDELSFFLELRNALVGGLPVTNHDPPHVTVSYQQCSTLLEKALGTFSPVLQMILKDAEKLVSGGLIDYADFANLMVRYYQTERKKRRNAVRLMFQSGRFAGPSGGVDFENLVAMVQTLGFQGSLEDVFELYHEATTLSGGEVSLEAFLMAMDNLSFHFYSIELPMRLTRMPNLTRMTKQQLTSHWTTFSGWFQGFTDTEERFDGWLRSKVAAQARVVAKLFQDGAPPTILFKQYRNLLDYFQFMLDVLAQSQTEPMPARKSERELIIFENLIDLLVTWIFREEEGTVRFTEFE
jgi:hypothetical protein